MVVVEASKFPWGSGLSGTCVETNISSGTHTDMSTCLCVHIHTRVGESQLKSKGANDSHMSAGGRAFQYY